MNILTGIILPLIAGLMLGTLYFGGLWLTLRELPDSRRPALLTVTSYFVRLSMAFAVFYVISLGGHWERMVVCLAGFVLVRITMVRILKPPRLKHN